MQGWENQPELRERVRKYGRLVNWPDKTTMGCLTAIPHFDSIDGNRAQVHEHAGFRPGWL